MIIFDKEKQPWINILLHSNSFSNSSEISTFIELNKTEYINIDVTPTSKQNLISFFNSNNIEVPTYDHANGYIGMKYSNGFKNASPLYDDDNAYLSSCSTKLTNEDIIISSDYDYFITDLTDPYFNKRNLENAQPIEYVKNIIRIIFSNNNIFLYRYNHSLNEGLYYLMRVKKIFPQLHEPWLLFYYLKNDFDFVFRNMTSLSTRLTLISKAYDKTAYYTLLKANNDTIDNILYHIGYFIMLCTGAFDDLAWIIHNIYNLNLHKFKVSLKHNDFKNKVKLQNIKLYNLLNDDTFIQNLESFYPIRDTLQHRNFLSGYILHGSTNQNNMLYIDKKSADTINSDLLGSPHIENEDLISISSNYLLEIMSERVKQIIYSVYDCIDWNEFKGKLPLDRQEEFDKAIKKYNTGNSFFNSFESDPMYL